eukprot:6375272-Prymnesium_polylepis.1
MAIARDEPRTRTESLLSHQQRAPWGVRVSGGDVNGVWGRALVGSGAKPQRGAGQSPAAKF